MILAGSSAFFNHASASVDGCYFYIIIHSGMSQRDWGIRSVPMGGRPGPESFKAIDTYTISKNHTNSPYIHPRINLDCPYEGWVFIIILVNEWTGSLVLKIHLHSCTTRASGTFVNFCRWSEVQLLLKCCLILKSRVEMLITLTYWCELW